MEFEKLMQEFAAKAGLGELDPTGDGSCHVEIDDMVVAFIEVPETRQLAMWAEVGEPPPEGRERIYRALMESMHMGRSTGGSSFSIDPETGKVILFRLDPLPLLDLDAFTTTLERFVNVLEAWRKIVAGLAEVAPKIAADENAAAEEARRMESSGFLQV